MDSSRLTLELSLRFVFAPSLLISWVESPFSRMEALPSRRAWSNTDLVERISFASSLVVSPILFFFLCFALLDTTDPLNYYELANLPEIEDFIDWDFLFACLPFFFFYLIWFWNSEVFGFTFRVVFGDSANLRSELKILVWVSLIVLNWFELRSSYLGCFYREDHLSRREDCPFYFKFTSYSEEVFNCRNGFDCVLALVDKRYDPGVID